MAKFTYKEIKSIIDNTPTEWKGQSYASCDKVVKVGYYHKAGANWAYEVYATNYKNETILIVSVFGHVQ